MRKHQRETKVSHRSAPAVAELQRAPCSVRRCSTRAWLGGTRSKAHARMDVHVMTIALASDDGRDDRDVRTVFVGWLRIFL